MKNLIAKTLLIGGVAGIISSCEDKTSIIVKDFNKDKIKDILINIDAPELIKSYLFLSNQDSSFTKYIKNNQSAGILIFKNEKGEGYALDKKEIENIK